MARPYQGGTSIAVETVTASQTLGDADHGKKFLVGTDDLVITLPATKAGLEYSFHNIGATANNIITISPAEDDKIYGHVVTTVAVQADANVSAGNIAVLDGADDKDVINTKATALKGDWISICGDGGDGWVVTGGVGIWAKEA